MNAMTDHIPVLETARLRLRAPKLADLPALYAFYQTDRSHMVGGPLPERDVHRQMMSTIGSWALRGHGFWHIADRDTDEMLGATGILFAPTWHEPELGWSITADAQGKGIAFEAASAARSYAAKHNARSEALAKRLGATVERAVDMFDKTVNIWRHPKEAT